MPQEEPRFEVADLVAAAVELTMYAATLRGETRPEIRRDCCAAPAPRLGAPNAPAAARSLRFDGAVLMHCLGVPGGVSGQEPLTSNALRAIVRSVRPR